MTQNERNRTVATATGESTSETRIRGFSQLVAIPRESGLPQRGSRRRSRRHGRVTRRPFIHRESE